MAPASTPHATAMISSFFPDTDDMVLPSAKSAVSANAQCLIGVSYGFSMRLQRVWHGSWCASVAPQRPRRSCECELGLQHGKACFAGVHRAVYIANLVVGCAELGVHIGANGHAYACCRQRIDLLGGPAIGAHDAQRMLAPGGFGCRGEVETDQLAGYFARGGECATAP